MNDGPPSSPSVFWNEMYGDDGYLYGKEPNRFFADLAGRLPAGSLLLPAEGEGRNAVFAARLGWNVRAFDVSDVARAKALKLAEQAGVSIEYTIEEFAAPNLADESFDLVGLINSHVPPEAKVHGHRALRAALKPLGHVLVECLDKSHLQLGSEFGPKSPDLLYDESELRRDFGDFTIERLEVVTETLDHGRHNGPARVIRMVAQKPGQQG